MSIVISHNGEQTWYCDEHGYPAAWDYVEQHCETRRQKAALRLLRYCNRRQDHYIDKLAIQVPFFGSRILPQSHFNYDERAYPRRPGVVNACTLLRNEVIEMNSISIDEDVHEDEGWSNMSEELQCIVDNCDDKVIREAQLTSVLTGGRFPLCEFCGEHEMAWDEMPNVIQRAHVVARDPQFKLESLGWFWNSGLSEDDPVRTDSGYLLMTYIEDGVRMYCAGCRNFTFAEAMEHWMGDTDYRAVNMAKAIMEFHFKEGRNTFTEDK